MAPALRFVRTPVPPPNKKEEDEQLYIYTHYILYLYMYIYIYIYDIYYPTAGAQFVLQTNCLWMKMKSNAILILVPSLWGADLTYFEDASAMLLRF